MSEQSPIRILLVDDHAVVRSGLAAFLLAEEDMELIGEAADGMEAVKFCDRLQPDVILMDLMMPRMDGAAATRAIRSRYPQVQVLALTSYKEENLVQDVLKAGAIGYLLKNITANELANAIRAAHCGRPTLASEAAQVLIRATVTPATATPGYDLTQRERDVLHHLVQGLDNSQIAAALIISRSTAKFHVSNILSKLHATSRTKAVAIALQNKIIAKPPVNG